MPEIVDEIVRPEPEILSCLFNRVGTCLSQSLPSLRLQDRHLQEWNGTGWSVRISCISLTLAFLAHARAGSLSFASQDCHIISSFWRCLSCPGSTLVYAGLHSDTIEYLGMTRLKSYPTHTLQHADAPCLMVPRDYIHAIVQEY